MKTTGRVLMGLAIGLGLLVLGVGLFAYYALQTQPGQAFLLRTAIGQMEDRIDGRVEVGAIRSDGLLRGFTLHGLTIHDDRGRPFLEADSLQVGYAIRRLLARDISLAPTEVWAPSLVLETLHGDDRSNLARILRLEPAEPEEDPPEVDPGEEEIVEPETPRDEVVGAATALRVRLDGARIHDGRFLLRSPVDEDHSPRAIVETVPGFEGLHQRIEFSNIDARIARAAILDPDHPGERIEFDALSLTGQLFEEPFHVEDFRGEVRRVGSELHLVARELELPGSELVGQLALDWGDPDVGLTLEVRMTADPLDLDDLRWIEPGLPTGEGRLTLSGEGPLDGGRFRVTDAELRSGASLVRGRVGIELGETLSFFDTNLELDPLYGDLLDGWLEEPLPVGGRVRGTVALAGPLPELEIDGRVVYDDPELEVPASTLEARGTLLLTEGEVGVGRMSFRADPLDYGTLAAFLPDLPVRGTGSLAVEASGRLSAGLQLSADLRHRSQEGVDSRVHGAGSIRYADEVLSLALDGGLDPLELGGLESALELDLPIDGPLRGQYRVNGRLDDLTAWARIQTEGGVVTFDGRANVLDLEAGYRIHATTTDLELNAFLPELPDPSLVRGEVEVEGRGLDLETVEGTARVRLTESRSGHVLIDLADIDLQALDGQLLVHRFEVESPMGSAHGSGDLGLRQDRGTGEMEVAWELPDLAELRPLVMGDTIIQVDTLSAIEMETLRWDGVDLDTLAAMNGELLDGSASGRVHLRGGVQALDLDGYATVRDFTWAETVMAEGRVDFLARLDEFQLTGAEGVVDLVEVGWRQWTFLHAAAEGRWDGESGDAHLELLREEGESYRADGGFRVDSLGVEVDLRTLVLEMDDVEWSLERPSRIFVGDRRAEVYDFEIRRPDADAVDEEERVRILVNGVVDLEGDSDLTVDTERLSLERLGRLIRMEDPPAGLLDLNLVLRGPADFPEIDGELLLRDLNVGGTAVDQVEGTLRYRDRSAQARLNVDHEGQRLLVADGRYPVNLALTEVEDRFPDEDVDVVLEIDDLPAATILGFLEGIENVQGSLNGEVLLRGRPGDLNPSGSVVLSGGALSIPEIGLNPGEIEAEFVLATDGVVTVDGQARSRGLARVSGTIDLNELANPRFDLRINANGFQATERRDLDARVGGEITLTGAFQAPRVGGTVRVEQGNMFLEEFARTAEVVDLTDPAFREVVDTTLVADRPVTEAAENPFLNNLRVDVDLSIQRDFWLRSREMNVEIAGDLIVTFDRPAREILLVGNLEALRGNYNAFGRQFQVQEGVVEFVGTPGINPTLDIRAVHRLRREGQEPLNIIAVVEGPLLAMRISLESEAQPPIAESDLISYLLFGRPSFALASGEASILQGAAGAGVSVGIGTLAGQLSAVVAQQIGLDYFAITQAQDGGRGPMSGLGGAFADTQIEFGQYLAQDLFIAMVLRPISGMGGGAQIPGARLEWRFTDTWTLEAFVEDRFGREGVYTFGDAGLRLNRILGLEIYREWGY